MAGDAEMPAVGIAELVLRTQAALEETAHRVRAPSEELPEWRNRGGAAERRAEIDAGEERERQGAVHGHVPEEGVVADPVLDVARRDGGAQGKGVAHAAVRSEERRVGKEGRGGGAWVEGGEERRGGLGAGGRAVIG